MFLSVLPMVLFCLVGYGLRRLKILGPEDAQVIGKLLSLVALPALILRALITTSITPELIYLPISALGVVLGLTLLGWLGTFLLPPDRRLRGTLVTTFPTFEGGAVGYPLMLLAFGDLGLSRILLFDLAQAVFLLTVVYSLSAVWGRQGTTPLELGGRLLRTPFFWAIVVGLGLNLLQVRSERLLAFLDVGANGFLLLILLLLSLEFRLQLPQLPRYVALALGKTTCGLALGWLAATLLPISGVERTAVLVGAALPPSMLTILFTKENNLDTEFAVGFISVAVPLGLVLLAGLLPWL